MIKIKKKKRQECGKKVLGAHSKAGEKEGLQHVLTTQEGRRLEGEVPREYIRRTVDEAFSQLEQKGTVDSSCSSRGGAELCNNKLCNNEGDQREWDKAERKVLVGTATGPDDISIKLIKTLGKTRQIEVTACD